MRLILRVSSPGLDDGDATHIFTEEGGTIGRSAGQSWVLPHNMVSGLHAVVSYSQGRFYIRDVSRNGIAINSPENRLVREIPYLLNPGDHVFIDPYVIEVSVDNEEGHAGLDLEADPFALRRPNRDPSPPAYEELDPLKFFPPSKLASKRSEVPTDDSALDAHYSPPHIPEGYNPLDDRCVEPIVPSRSPMPQEPAKTHQKGEAHEWTGEEVRDAGRKGGLASHKRRREQMPAGNGVGEMNKSRGSGVPGATEGVIAPPQPRALPLRDTVKCSVFSPPTVNAGDCVVVQVFAHLPSDENRVKTLAKTFDRLASHRAAKVLDDEVERGRALTFGLSITGIKMEEPVQSLVWGGIPDAVQFVVNIPSDQRPARLIGTVVVSHASIPLGHLKFILEVVAKRPTMVSEYSAGQAWTRYTHAFISYASPDRAEVLKRVQMLSRVHIEVFQDLLSLEPGERWANALYRNIDKSDVFFLFWSSAAKSSEWVLKEVRYAIDRRAGDDTARPEIIPILLEGPPPVLPPPELSALHFDDRFLYFIAGSP